MPSVKAPNDGITAKLSGVTGQCKEVWSAKDAGLKEIGVENCGQPVSTFIEEVRIWSCLWYLDSHLPLECPACQGERQARCQEEGQTLEAPARHFYQASN